MSADKRRVSVLMAVHAKDDADLLRQALNSLADQTLQPGEVVLVCDGPLTPALDEVIDSYSQDLPLREIRLPRSNGLGSALAVGVTSCTNELIARADSDDINHPKRLELQSEFISADPALAAVGSWTTEFERQPHNLVAERRLPVDPERLSAYARHRCPLNHPTVLLRRSAVLSVGNYSTHPVAQDYYLWARLLQGGHKLANLPKFLVNMHGGRRLGEKRAGIPRIKVEIGIQKNLHQMGFINRRQLIVNVAMRIVLRLVPGSLRRAIYRRAWRIEPGNSADQVS